MNRIGSHVSVPQLRAAGAWHGRRAVFRAPWAGQTLHGNFTVPRGRANACRADRSNDSQPARSRP
jgi:hypothetical protein